MAGWEAALCKKEEKIVAPSRGLGYSGFGVSYYPATLNLHLSMRRHHGTPMGFLFNIRFFKEEKLEQEGVARTREPIAEGQRGAPQMPWICPRQCFLGFVLSFWRGLVSPNKNPPLPVPSCQKTEQPASFLCGGPPSPAGGSDHAPLRLSRGWMESGTGLWFYSRSPGLQGTLPVATV